MKTVKRPATVEFIEKKSRFIGSIERVSTEDAAVAFIEKIKSEHRQASHNVYAYSLTEGGRARFSDDGEPSGTAGFPVLNVINQNGLKDVIIVVTRYFGGILLGAGGLARAYGKTASLALTEAGILELLSHRRITVVVPYSLFDKLRYNLSEIGVEPLNILYEADVTFELLVKEEQSADVTALINDTTNAAAIIELGETIEA